MKLVIAIFILMLGLSVASANTVRIGNGGDTIRTAQPGIMSILMTAPHKLRLLAHSWMYADNIDTVLPKERFEEFENIIERTPLEIQEAPCIVNGQKKSAAAYVTPYQSICVSWKRLERSASKDFPELQILALLAHEYLHLLNYDEADAVIFQKYVMQYLMKNGLPEYNPNAVYLVDGQFLNRFNAVNWDDKDAVTSYVMDMNSMTNAQLKELTAVQTSVYPLLKPANNILGDIYLRLRYLQLISVANWTTGPDIPRLRMTLEARYFVKDKRTRTRPPITAHMLSGLFEKNTRLPLMHPNTLIPYIKNDTKDEVQSILKELEDLIEQLNKSLSSMDLYSTHISFVEKR
ncbi:hypothetical protein B9G69_012620 [Bdellovibrio sp. SKB1291214]|uniref:hypothetical protein n=1 Tax=Bdellovibrio sp. SKB1291214 TaxID=1732569 RepID=UPI000B51A70B|nr:hypothetical protein [Bdellovibrio sp. SKB1291214]UYL07890.1 hypothetical protein B9G69_012620 [Bdellovibrio sp. SKB1291214]